MTRVGTVAATPNAATAPIRKGAARDDGSTPFAHALLDLLATIPQPAPKPVVVKAPPPAVTPDDAAPKGGADATATAVDAAPVALLQAPLADTPAPAVANDATTGGVVARHVATANGIATADAVVASSVAVGAANPATDQPADASAVATDHAAPPPDAGAAAMLVAAALTLAASGAGAQLPAQVAVPNSEATSPSPVPAGPPAPTPATTASTAPSGSSPSPQFFAAFIMIAAQWHPPAVTATTGDALASDATLAAPTNGATATPAAPLPDGLAQLLAATVRQVSHASPDSGSTPAPARATHHAATTENDASGSAPTGTTPSAAATAAAAAYPAVAAGAPVPLLNGGQLPSAPLDPGPRPMPEPKTTPAPTAHATLELDADKTGASRIRIAVQGSQVRATITASDIGLASLDRQLPELRRSLEERGFSDIRLAVRAQDHVGTVATNASSTADDTQSFARNRPDQQAQGATQQQDTGDRAGSQRRRRQKEDEAS